MAGQNPQGQTLQSGVAPRVLPVPGTHNFREVAGYAAAGGRIAPGLLFRSDGLHSLGEQGVAELDRLGIRTVIDLRSPAECEALPDAVGERALRSVPIFPDTDAAADGDGMPDSLAVVYEFMIEHCGPRLIEAVRELAQEQALPAVVHCAAGKDRTGVLVALVLSALGVDHETVAADYAVTAELLTPAFRELLTGGGEVSETMLGAAADDMFATLALLDERYGGAAGYLVAHGLGAAELDALRAVLVVPDAEVASVVAVQAVAG